MKAIAKVLWMLCTKVIRLKVEKRMWDIRSLFPFLKCVTVMPPALSHRIQCRWHITWQRPYSSRTHHLGGLIKRSLMAQKCLYPSMCNMNYKITSKSHEWSQVNEEQNRADKWQRMTIKGGGSGKFNASMRRYLSTCWVRMLWSSILQAVMDAGALDVVSADRNLRSRNTTSEQVPSV